MHAEWIYELQSAKITRRHSLIKVSTLFGKPFFQYMTENLFFVLKHEFILISYCIIFSKLFADFSVWKFLLQLLSWVLHR